MNWSLGSHKDKLQEFFIGGSLELEDVSYIRIPQNFRGRVLNKYGFQSESSGRVKVKGAHLYCDVP